MQCKWNFSKFVIILFFPIFLSCHSNQVYENNLIDYSDTIDVNMTYNIGITIYNKDIILLKQNIMNAIVQSDGKITQEQTENINRHNINVDIPKNKTMIFMESIKKLGIVIDESKSGYDRGLQNVYIENRLENAISMLEKYNELLEEANTITDKITLEKEILNVEREIEIAENGIKEMELRQEYNTINIIIFNK